MKHVILTLGSRTKAKKKKKKKRVVHLKTGHEVGKKVKQKSLLNVI